MHIPPKKGINWMRYRNNQLMFGLQYILKPRKRTIKVRKFEERNQKDKKKQQWNQHKA